MYFKFENKKAALDFCIEVNKGENIQVSEENVTTGYAQPFEFKGVFYVLADEVTSKYTDKEAIDLFAPIDTTPPTIYGLGVVIPEQYLWAFPNDKFILHGTGFEIPIVDTEHGKAVDVAYLQWPAFLDEIWKPEHKTIFEVLEKVWLYLEKEADAENFIQMPK
jgi:hypothetical protein